MSTLRRGAVALGSVVSLLALQALVLAPPAVAGVVCSPSNHVATVTVSGPGAFVVTIGRSGDNLTVNSAPCGTVGPLGDPAAIDQVNVGGDPSAFGQVIVTLAGGPLGPGATHEQNSTSDEIEMDIFGGTTSVTVFGSAGNDMIVAGSRTQFGGGGVEFLNHINLNGFEDGASPDPDVDIHGQPSIIPLFGSGGNDILSGQGFGLPGVTGPAFAPMRFSDGDGNDTVIGGGSDDEIRSMDFTGGDAYSGGAGFDLLRYDDRSQGVNLSQDGQANDGVNCPGPTCEGDNVGGDIEEFQGTGDADTIRGGEGRQFISPGSGDDHLFGGPGNDVLFGGFGADDFHGGDGTGDAVSFEDDANVHVTMDSVADDGQGDEGDNVRADVEVVYGSAGNDTLIGNDGPNQLHGGEGNDTLRGLGGNDLLDGGGASPRQTPEPDDGSDVFFGGPGVDAVTEAGHTGGVIVTFDNLPNDAVVSQSEGSDNVRDDVENVIGTPFADRVFGSPLDNRFVGGQGNDRLVGAEGDDVLVPGPGTDTAIGGPGLDVGDYGDAVAAITANLNQGTATGDGADSLSGVERLVGSDLDDHLTGSDAANRLAGADGDDVLSGLQANDVLVGGGGNDTMNGGPGTDTCTQGPGSGPRNGCEAA